MPMPCTLPEAMIADWPDHMEEVKAVPVCIVGWPGARWPAWLPTPILQHCHFLSYTNPPYPQLPAPRTRLCPEVQKWGTVAFWGDVSADLVRECRAFIFLGWSMRSTTRGSSLEAIWAAASQALPIGCRRALIWQQSRGVEVTVPRAVQAVDPLSLPDHMPV